MITGSFSRSFVLALGLACAAGAQTSGALSVTPNPAPPGQAFTLYLQGAGGDCYTTFSRESVTVTGQRIDLRYTADRYILNAGPDTGRTVICPVYDGVPGSTGAIYPYSMPVFSMPALKAGVYEVWATQMPACLYEQPMCKIAMPAPASAGKLTVGSDAQPAYTFTPSSTPAGQAFDLHLLSYDFTCGTTYDSLSAVVADGVITLNFLDHPNPAAMCPAVYMPYGPIFKMPALKMGSYAVAVNRLSAQGAVKAGTLQVTTEPAHKGWYLKERKVAADKAFTMQLLRDDIGNCQTTFSDLSLTVSTGKIAVSFAMQQHPERVCIQNIHPWGPSFSMPALKAGIYPVSAAVCEGDSALCKKGLIAPTVVDTLVALSTSAIRMSDLRRNAPAVELRGRTADFTLPEGGTGAWRAELMTLDGRTLGESTVSGSAGQRVSVPVGRAPANAVSLLRLTSPAGKQSFLPIVR